MLARELCLTFAHIVNTSQLTLLIHMLPQSQQSAEQDWSWDVRFGLKPIYAAVQPLAADIELFGTKKAPRHTTNPWLKYNFHNFV